jgi:hypothetical protein
VPNTVPIVSIDKTSVDAVGADSATVLVGIAALVAIDVCIVEVVVSRADIKELPVRGKPALNIVGTVWD